MEKDFKKDKRMEPPPFDTIKSAVGEDVLAIMEILKHYERYMNRLSMRKFYDEDGRAQYCVDETLRHMLEIKLITVILNFKI